jgi:catechol 2,3-dioxygenase-like lactoylglutathione lyase family enzyme
VPGTGHQHVTSLTVEGLVPYAHVADLTRSIRFYRRLGFVVENTSDYDGRLAWASLRCGNARLMIALATAPVDPERQAVLFYLHAHNVAGIRKQLLDDGVEISEIRHPEYMPAGEVAFYDPDGYCLVIGQPELLGKQV